MTRADTPNPDTLPDADAAARAHAPPPLDPAAAAELLTEMAAPLAASVLADLPPAEAAAVLVAMNPDDRVDVLAHVPLPLQQQILGAMPPADAAETRALGRHPPDSVGGIMTTQVAALPESLTCGQAIDEIRRLSDQLELVHYVYTVDPAGRLSGVVSMRDLLLSDPARPLARALRRDVISLPATADQEAAARILEKYDLVAVPVVDAGHRLIGLVTVDDVVDVMVEEATEDVQKMFGAGAGERLESAWHYSFRKRVGWLVINLALTTAAASVVGLFQETLRGAIVLAVYLPVVAGMGGNASAQAMAVMIRGLAVTGEADWRTFRRVLAREARVGLTTGAITGTLAAGVALTLHLDHGALLGVVVGLALLLNHTVGCVWGATIPYLAWRLGFDPAQSATIFTTTLTDLLGFLLVLSLASFLT